MGFFRWTLVLPVILKAWHNEEKGTAEAILMTFRNVDDDADDDEVVVVVSVEYHRGKIS